MGQFLHYLTWKARRERARERETCGDFQRFAFLTQSDPPEFEVRSKQVASLVGLRTGCLTF